MNGTFPYRFQGLVAPFVRGATVLDLGAGDGSRAATLKSLGAARVVAVDKRTQEEVSFSQTGVEFVRGYFDDAVVQGLTRESDRFVAHLAWPQNCSLPGLVPILQRATTVIYVGCCTGGTFCGNTEVFDHFRTRQVLVYEPDPQNTLIVYGTTLLPRILVHYEEWAGYQTNHVAPFSSTRSLLELVE